MKKLLTMAVMVTAIVLSSCDQDDSKIWDGEHGQEDRVSKLEKLCEQMNTNISSLQKIGVAVEKQLSISQMKKIANGYIINFSDGSTVTIKNGMTSGEAPVIGISKYYSYYCWTLNGGWMTIKTYRPHAGTYGITPQLKIEKDRWKLSIDNGNTFTDIGQATEADITDGKGSMNSIFKSITKDNYNVYFTLVSGYVITIPRSDNLLNETIHVETKGNLKNVLADYDYARIGSLKISGVLNYADFVFIYEMMPKLKDLDISEVNITALPSTAFIKSIENLILPNTLTTIVKEMFYNSKLKTVVIPASVETIESLAFSGCESLATVTFAKGSQLKTIGSRAFMDCIALTSIEIPASVETIEAAAFKGCKSLATVTFAKGSQLKTINGISYDYGAFSGCTALTSIEIPASVETIEAAAFENCI